MAGFLFPKTPSGKSSLIPEPPWHYSGEMLTVEYRTDPARVAELLPVGASIASEDPVSENDTVTRVDIVEQRLVSDRNGVVVPQARLGDTGDFLALLKEDRTVRELTDPELGALDVLHNRHSPARGLGGRMDPVKKLLVEVVVTE